MRATDEVIDLRQVPDPAGLTTPVGERTGEEADLAVRLRNLRGIGVAVLIVFNALDIVTTSLALDAGAIEGNPLSDMLITTGWVGYLKAALLFALGLRVLRGRPRLGPTCALWFVVGVYAAVIAVNTMALHHLGVI